MDSDHHNLSAWQRENTIERVLCPFCSVGNQVVVVEIPRDAPQKKSSVKASVRCTQCKATGTFQCQARLGNRVYYVEWFGGDADRLPPSADDSDGSIRFVREDTIAGQVGQQRDAGRQADAPNWQRSWKPVAA